MKESREIDDHPHVSAFNAGQRSSRMAGEMELGTSKSTKSDAHLECSKIYE